MQELVYTSRPHTSGVSALACICSPKHRGHMAGNYRDLIAWQKAVSLAQSIYRLTETFPKREIYGLSSQMRRAVVSIAANIAEGNGRISRGEWQQFLGYARGSHLELETELTISCRVDLITAEQLKAVLSQCEEVGRLINGLLKASKNRPRRKPFSSNPLIH
jgi:four helix bundle protein